MSIEMVAHLQEVTQPSAFRAVVINHAGTSRLHGGRLLAPRPKCFRVGLNGTKSPMVFTTMI